MSTKPKTSEKDLERHLVKEVKKLGGAARKFVPTFANGYPDRLVLMPGGRTYWLELKSGGKRPEPLQLARHRELRALGFVCEWVNTWEGLYKFLELIQKPIL